MLDAARCLNESACDINAIVCVYVFAMLDNYLDVRETVVLIANFTLVGFI